MKEERKEKKKKNRSTFKENARYWAGNGPLIAALLSPASTLYDIPALSQRWYTFNGQSLSDPKASLILSGLSLAASVLANTALVFRFSVRVTKAWRWATRISMMGWIIKTLVGVANLITFGALSRNGPGYQYDQGFWCAILSVVISGIISILLIAHYTLSFDEKFDAEMRFQGRAIITSEMILFAVIALMALIFSRIEHWTYVDAIYFSVVSILSIGFGDFSPTYTSTKILLFPFFLTGIALLANQISIIVNAASHRSQTRKQEFRAKFEKQIAEREKARGSKVEDLSEIDALHQEAKRLKKQIEAEENATEMIELFYSACTLVTFWLLSALIYHYMEGWSYGNSLYFSYIFFFTIGYGDFSPVTPVGRVVFIIWALISVPIMTTFVVQTIQTITGHAARIIASTTSTKRLERERIRDEYFAPHSSYLEDAMGIFEESSGVSTSSDKDDKEEVAKMDAENAKEAKEEEEKIDREERSTEEITISKALLFDMLNNAAYLEAQARRLIIDNMNKDSYARLLLSADRNLQHYTLYKLGATKWITKMEDYEKNVINKGKDSDLERVREYRKTWAKLLVMGSKLAQLEGDDLLTLQRKSPFHHSQSQDRSLTKDTSQSQDVGSGDATLH